VRRVDFDRVESGGNGALRRGRPGADHRLALGCRQLARRLPAFGDRFGRRSDRLPDLGAGFQVLLGQWSHALHRALGARLATAVSELDADRRSLAPHERDQRLETFHLRIVPEAEVALVDEPDLFDGRRLHKDEPEATQRVAAEMHDVECTAGISGVAAIVNHRWHDETISEFQTSNGKWLEQHWPCGFAAVD
jgi:hypothetical protein